MDLLVVFCILFVFMLVLYCFCVATEFSVNKDLYSTCHVRSHSVTCHPAEVTFPPCALLSCTECPSLPKKVPAYFEALLKRCFSPLKQKRCKNEGLCSGTVSVRVSVPAWAHSSNTCEPGGQEISIGCCTARSSKRGQCHFVGRRRRLNAGLFM